MARAKQPVSVNGLEFDALIDEERTLGATVPQYSVEDGYSVSDSIILDPEKLNMTLYVTNTPVTWVARHGTSQDRVNSVCKQLEELYLNKEPVTVVTTDATYTSMAIESISFKKSVETGYSREIPISFVKIRVTKAKTTTIPDNYGKSGTTAAQAGTASTSAGSSGGSGGSGNSGSNGGGKASILYNAASGLGLL